MVCVAGTTLRIFVLDESSGLDMCDDEIVRDIDCRPDLLRGTFSSEMADTV